MVVVVVVCTIYYCGLEVDFVLQAILGRILSECTTFYLYVAHAHCPAYSLHCSTCTCTRIRQCNGAGEIGDGARRTARTASERERRLQQINASVQELHAAETFVEMEARMPGSKCVYVCAT